MRWRARVMAAVAVALLAGSFLAPNSLAQDASPTPPPDGPGMRSARMVDAAGAEVGFAVFSAQSDGTVQVAVTVTGSGLAPGDHGIHVHERGLCEGGAAEPFESAGEHFNPAGAPHGGPPITMGELALLATPGDATPAAPDADAAHAGDLGNVTATEGGSVSATIVTDRFTLDDGPAGLDDADGSALIIHLLPDDLVAQPGGGSAGRVLCAVVYDGTESGATPSA